MTLSRDPSVMTFHSCRRRSLFLPQATLRSLVAFGHVADDAAAAAPPIGNGIGEWGLRGEASIYEMGSYFDRRM